jgi:hypothetical protein
MKHMGMLLLTLVSAFAAFAQESTGEAETYFPQQLSAGDLLVHCASSSLTDRGRERQRYCSGFVSGVEEATRLLGTAAEPPLRLCIPARTSAREFREAFVRYGGRRGADLNRPAALVVVEALREAYPCRP